MDAAAVTGLAASEAERRLREEGPNELPSQKQRSIFAIAFEVVREPMFLMLVAAGGLYLAMGEPSDAAMLLGFVFVVMAITIVQERRTERALDALRDLSSPRALVIRDGERRRIAGRDVVRGDLVVLAEGDRVPADGLLRRGTHLSIDESLLTGESVPVRKAFSENATSLDPPGGEDLPSVFSGTLVTAGQGLVEVLATGAHSQLGRIGRTLGDLEPEPTPLQRETGRLVRTFALVALATCGLVVVAYALIRGGSAAVWKEGLLAGIAMAMATLPEEFPVVLTVFLAIGAWRISRSGVLTRRMPAVETLGAATVLCVDKTGTLTQNRMTVRRLRVDGAELDLAASVRDVSGDVRSLLEHAGLACRQDPFDPMEQAIVAAAERLGGAGHRQAAGSLVREYPLAPGRPVVAHAWRSGEAGHVVIASKGAPEAVLTLCRVSGVDRERWQADITALAARGLRVLGVARGTTRTSMLPEDPSDLALEFVGLVGLEDPLRPTVPAAVAECHTAGVRVVMITGDYPVTASSIAQAAGLTGPDRVLTGAELERLSDDQLAAQVGGIQVFARVVPEQKLRIVEALKANGEIVAMTGDGVNDAPALKAAHIGIAMGSRGTDVAREAASLVLVDDDFSSIVAAIRLGRRIFDNIRKAIVFVLAVHIPIAGLSILPVFVRDWPLLLLPVHIGFLELVIDPSCSLVFEADEAEPDAMRRPPRDPREPLFSASMVAAAAAQGVSVLVACLAVFLLARAGHSDESARALTFATLVVAFLVVILVNRSWTRTFVETIRAPNTAFRWVVAGTLAVLAVVLFVPAAQRLFHFAPLHPSDLASSVAAGLACALAAEAGRWLRRWRVAG